MIQDSRLGRNGVQEIKSHPFFKSINWTNLRNCPPPYKPPVVLLYSRSKALQTPAILMISKKQIHGCLTLVKERARISLNRI